MANPQFTPNKDGTLSMTIGSLGERSTPVPLEGRWHPDKVKDIDVQKRYGGVTVHELVTTWPAAYHFPVYARQWGESRLGSHATTLRYEWAIDKLEAWDAEIRALAARLPKVK